MSERQIEVDGRVLHFPSERVYIEPVLGDLIELRLDTVGRITYAVVEEYAFSDRWLLCYSTCFAGWRFRWLFRAVRPTDVTEPLIPGNDDVLDVYYMVGGDENVVAVVEETSTYRTIKFLHLDDDERPLLLLLRFDLPQNNRPEDTDDD